MVTDNITEEHSDEVGCTSPIDYAIFGCALGWLGLDILVLDFYICHFKLPSCRGSYKYKMWNFELST